jgi:hypothetical protein
VSALVVTAALALVIQGDTRLGSYAVKGDGSLGGAIAAFGRPSGRWRTGIGCTTRWRALGLRIDWYNLGGADPCSPRGGRFYRALVTGRGWRTAKGLRVGDSAERLRRLFPRAERHGDWQWLVPRFYSVPGYRYPGLAAKVVRGRVAALAVTFPAGGD